MASGMSEEHREVLRSQRTFILANLYDDSSVTDYLYQEKIFSVTTKEEIEVYINLFRANRPYGPDPRTNTQKQDATSR